MVPVKLASLFFLLLAGIFSSGLAQTPAAPPPPPTFSVLNLIRSPTPATLKIGSAPVGEGEMALGFYSGILHWLPAAPLLVEAAGFPPLRVPPAKIAPGACPLYVLLDALEKPPGGGDPKPVLKYLEVANAKERGPCFFDGLNLTARDSLSASLEGRNLVLEKGKRTRLTTKNGFRMQIRNGPEVALGPFEENPGGMLLVFYENQDGTVAYVTTYDMQTQP